MNHFRFRQFLFFIFFCVTIVSSNFNNIFAQKEGYELVWHDEFDGTELDTTKWRHRGLGNRRGGRVTEDAISFDGKGNLLITTTILDSLNYRVGMIGTQSTFNPKYGYFECRAKFSKKLAWDSFWLQSPTAYTAGPTSTTGAEIDIFEYTGSKHGIVGYDIAHNIHWADNSGEMKSWGSHNSVVTDVEGYHKVAVEWTPSMYIFYVNDVFTFVATKGVSQVEQYIILSEEPYFWNSLPDSIQNGATIQDTFFVDYVRVYQKAPLTDVNNDNYIIPSVITLEQNYPNPFNPTTKIKYSIPTSNYVSLIVYDTMGRKIIELVKGNKNAGNYSVSFDASNLSSGIYYYRLLVGSNYSMTKKMLLIQ